VLDFRPVFFISGWLLCALAGLMILPAIVDAAGGDKSWPAFLEAAGVTAFVGVALILGNQAKTLSMNLRQAFAFTTLTWVFIAVFAALPFLFSPLGMNVTDSLFESMSGITTTGATVMTGLDSAPRGLLLWRSMLQWLGGIGIVVFAMSVLPILRVGGMQLFRTEAFDTPEKVLPRAKQLAITIGWIYLGMTAVAALALALAGMPVFDAICHAMTSIATGGFSTRDLSLGAYDSSVIHWIIIVCMLAGSLPFVIYIDAVRMNFRPLTQDSQIRVFLAVVLISVAVVWLWLWSTGIASGGDALTKAAFNTISILTGTGYATDAFDRWGHLPFVTLLVLMFVGGCAGSTTCAIKIFRFQVAYAIGRTQMQRLMQPHGVFIPYYNRRPIPEEVAASVMGFFFLFVMCFAVMALGFSLLGLDPITSLSAAASAIANVGPGLGDMVGPSTTFQKMPEAAKWIMTAGMLVGRLEIFSILILFSPAFWRG
jgi:trk system potassium uptake protein TrkH